LPISTATQNALNLKANSSDVNTSLNLKADKATTYTKTEIDTYLALKENKANKGVANGYASLDVNGKVPLSQLPTIASSVSTLTDVNLNNISNNEILTYNAVSQKWENKNIENISSNLTSGELTPIGSIMAYYGGGEIPEGWLLCDGSEFDIMHYPLLHNFLNSHILPDLRGYFLRGLGGVDPELGRTIGSIQEDEFKSHQHELPVNNDATLLHPTNNVLMTDNGIFDNGFNSIEQTNSKGGKETRPKNIAVNYIIKAKHILVTGLQILAGSEDVITEYDVENKKITISLSSPLSSKANVSDVYTKSEIESLVIDAGFF
jgi:microcystin-dependent protein